MSCRNPTLTYLRGAGLLGFALLGCLVAATAYASAAAAATTQAHWVWPLDPRPAVVNGFDPPIRRWLPGHRGVDLAGFSGQRVLSAGAGEVSFAGRLAGVGIVVVRSGQVRTTYQPVRPTVRVGEVVDAGSTLGRLEEFGSHCRPQACLHWGLLRDRTYLDPLRLVGSGPPRLLPLYGPAGGVAVPLDTPRQTTSRGQPTAVPAAQGSAGWAVAAGAGAGAAAVLLLRSSVRR